MIIHKKCDIFESGADIICHQVNCRGVMGSGVAKQIKDRYPLVFDEYKKWCVERTPKALLGCTQFVRLVPSRAEVKDGEFYGIINMFGQLNYGYDGKCYTSYEALARCFNTVNEFCRDFFDTTPVLAIPYKIGCARGGGDWDKVLSLMEESFTDVVVLVCECDKG